MKRWLLMACLLTLPACGGGEPVEPTTETTEALVHPIGGGSSVIYSDLGGPCGWEYVCVPGLVCERPPPIDGHVGMGTCVNPPHP